MLNANNKSPILSPGKHLMAAGAVGFLTFFLFIGVSDYVMDLLIPQNWNRQFVMIASFLILVPIPIFIFDKFVPARCPKCTGKMFGSSFRPAYKECTQCKHMYRYGWFESD